MNYDVEPTFLLAGAYCRGCFGVCRLSSTVGQNGRWRRTVMLA
jgi:hypothetical protein